MIGLLYEFLRDMEQPVEHDKPYFNRNFDSYEQYVDHVKNQNRFLTWIRGESDIITSEKADSDIL